MNSKADATRPQSETMDGIYRFQRHIYDVTRRYYLLGRDDLLAGLAVPAGGSVLEIGCGTGRNLVGVARRFPSAKLFGLDISEEMLKSAGSAMVRHDCLNRTRLACADATDFSAQDLFGQPTFDRVFFSYTLSMIPNWQLAVENALNCLGPGGQLHVVDFGQGDGLPKTFRRGLFAWLRIFHVSPRDQLASHSRHLAATKAMVFSHKSRFRDYTWQIKITKVT